VSGGLDSSAIYCGIRELQRLGFTTAQLRGYTYIFPGDNLADETAYLQLLDGNGDTIRRITAHSGWLESASLAALSSEAPAPQPQLNSEYRMLRAAAQDGCDTLLDGAFGDQAVGHHAYWLDLFFGLRWMHLLRDMGEQPLWQDDTSLKDWLDVLKPNLLRILVPEFLLRVARRLRRVANDSESPRWYSSRLRRLALERACSQPSPRFGANSHHAADLYRMAHQRYYLHSWETLLKRAAEFGLELKHPFTDPDLLQLLMALPGEQVSVGGVFRGLYREAMRHILPEPIRLRRSKADFTPAVRNAARQELQSFHFGRDMIAAEMGFVEPVAFRRDLSRMRRFIDQRDNICAPRELTNLLALEIWLRVYFRGEKPQSPSVTAARVEAMQPA
jgi:asparagine synthase (glutamine-hydrolysing)